MPGEGVVTGKEGDQNGHKKMQLKVILLKIIQLVEMTMLLMING